MEKEIISAEIQMVRKLLGATQLIKPRDGNIVNRFKITQLNLAKKSVVVKSAMDTEEKYLKQNLV